MDKNKNDELNSIEAPTATEVGEPSLTENAEPSEEEVLNKLNAEETLVEVNHTESPTFSAKDMIKEEKKSKRGNAVLITCLCVIFVPLIAALVYYFVIRVPDSEFVKASAITDAMIASAKKMAQLGKNNSGTLSETKVIDINEESKELTVYKANLKKLQESAVLQKDGDVKTTYDVNKKRIEDYATSTSDWLDTVGAYANISQKCIDGFNNMNDIKVIADYDAKIKGCSDYINSHKTVPMKDFNDNFYVQYRGGMLDYIAAARVYFKAILDNDTVASEKAKTQVLATAKEFQNAGNGKDFNLENTLNPSEQLINLRSTINKRKDVLLR
jgi:hypothetical protein